jgi:hypothetical protein
MFAIVEASSLEHARVMQEGALEGKRAYEVATKALVDWFVTTLLRDAKGGAVEADDNPHTYLKRLAEGGSVVAKYVGGVIEQYEYGGNHDMADVVDAVVLKGLGADADGDISIACSAAIILFAQRVGCVFAQLCWPTPRKVTLQMAIGALMNINTADVSHMMFVEAHGAAVAAKPPAAARKKKAAA